jgi:hypothetical protein
MILSLGLLTFITAASAYSADAPISHHNGLLTSSYGIVTEDDLAYDEQLLTIIPPYNPSGHTQSRYWQCFPKRKVTAKFRSWRGPDGMGPADKIYTMCTLEIHVRSEGELQIFGDRRAHQIDFCHSFLSSWKKVTKNQEILCLDGEGSQYESDDIDGKFKLWTWIKVKTKKGCYAYFPGDCDINGSSK